MAPSNNQVHDFSIPVPDSRGCMQGHLAIPGINQQRRTMVHLYLAAAPAAQQQKRKQQQRQKQQR